MRGFLAVLRLTLISPREGLRAILARDLPPGTGLTGLALIAVLSSLALHAMGGLSSAPDGAAASPEEALFGALLGTPFTIALVQFALFITMALLVLLIGRWRGGTGTADQTFLAMAWLEAAMFSVQIGLLLVMAVLLLIAPPLFVLAGALSGPLLVGLFFWYLSSFIAELHGFRSVLRVLLAVIVTLILASFLLSPILVALIGPEALNV